MFSKSGWGLCFSSFVRSLWLPSVAFLHASRHHWEHTGSLPTASFCFSAHILPKYSHLVLLKLNHPCLRCSCCLCGPPDHLSSFAFSAPTRQPHPSASEPCGHSSALACPTQALGFNGSYSFSDLIFLKELCSFLHLSCMKSRSYLYSFREVPDSPEHHSINLFRSSRVAQAFWKGA